jgi:phytol kinase
MENNLSGIKNDSKYFNISYTLKKEFFRKTIHMMAFFIPYFYYFHQQATLTLLLSITLAYFISEVLRVKKNIYIPVVSAITLISSRDTDRDNGKIILGPITLALGIFLSLAFFDYRSAVIAIYALSFGDGVASLFGGIIGGWKIPFTFGKTISGSSGCFSVLSIVYLACGLSFYQALSLAFIAALIEVFPTGDYDNLLIPVATGVIAKNLFL